MDKIRWGENKNAHPKHGTDVASVVPPNLGWCQPHLPGTTVSGVYPCPVTGATRLCYFGETSHFALRLGGPFKIDVRRRPFSETSLLSGATCNLYFSLSKPCWFWLIISKRIKLSIARKRHHYSSGERPLDAANFIHETVETDLDGRKNWHDRALPRPYVQHRSS